MCRLSEAELNCVSTKMRLRPGVQAVGERNVDQPVLAADRNGRLRSLMGEREEARAPASAQDDGEDVVHCGGLYAEGAPALERACDPATHR